MENSNTTHSNPSTSEARSPRGVYVSTYGCQMNVNDSERMLSLLDMINFSQVNDPAEADLILINSCAIREKPVHKVYSEVGRYRQLKKDNPSLRIGVAGCVAQQEKDRLMANQPMIDFVFGPDNIDQLPEIVGKIFSNQERIVAARFDHQRPYHIETMVRNPGVSTFVNITKGCDNFCTFCIVPFTRGRERSRPLSHLIEDINALVKKGVKEVTLLGQNVNSYRSECGAGFAELLKALSIKTDIERIRFTTSHPKDFNEELVDVMAEHRNKIMDYIHLPVQSGNSEVLERMNRGYTRDEYISKAKMIQERLPGVSLSTDIIVGFPGESREQFEDTLSLLDEVPYESLFAFAYSPRPFTKASKFEDHLSLEEKNGRLNELFAKHREIAFKLAAPYEGRTLDVLVEEYHQDEGRVSGRSTQNKVVHFAGTADLVGQTVQVKILEAFPLTLRGERLHS